MKDHEPRRSCHFPRAAAAALLLACGLAVPACRSIRPAAWRSGDARPAAGGDWTVPGLDLTMKWIPPGRFLMGSTPAERAWAAGPEGLAWAYQFASERDPFPVEIEHGFWLGETTVTVGQWKRFVAETGFQTDAERSGGLWHQGGQGFEWLRGRSWRNPGYVCYTPGDGDPVVGIGSRDAMAFCEWLTRREQAAGRLPEGFEYRLPGEAEWEYACRGGREGTRFWWGDSVRDGKGRLNIAGTDGAGWTRDWGFSDGYPHLAPVDAYGARGRNGFGLADMLGNIRELCLDGYDPNGPHPTPWFGDLTRRVARGGAFDDMPGRARCAARIWRRTGGADSHHGFRLALGRVVPRP